MAEFYKFIIYYYITPICCEFNYVSALDSIFKIEELY